MAPRKRIWLLLGGLVVALLVIVVSARRWPGGRVVVVRLLAVAHVAVVVELALVPLPVDGKLIADLHAEAAGGNTLLL